MRFQELHGDFGAEVRDFDVSAPTAPEDIDQLKKALGTYQLLLFRGGKRMQPERQLEISSWFGPLTDNTGDGKGWSVLHNENAAGSARLPFHSDFTYTDSPIKVISLHPIELPVGGTSTAYVSGVHAWASLPPERQHLLDDKTLRHVHNSAVVDGLPEFVADHPVRLVHPRTGVPVLFVTEHHAESIHELDREESDRLLAELFTHLYAPDRIYEHKWELYDLLIWDNLAVQHARPAEANPARGSRALQRVAVNEVTYAELVARAREQQEHRQLQGI